MSDPRSKNQTQWKAREAVFYYADIGTCDGQSLISLDTFTNRLTSACTAEFLSDRMEDGSVFQFLNSTKVSTSTGADLFRH